MNEVKVKIKFQENEISVLYFITEENKQFNKDTQKLSLIQTNQYGMITNIDTN